MPQVYDPAISALRELKPDDVWFYDFYIDHRRIVKQEDISNLMAGCARFGIFITNIRAAVKAYEDALKAHNAENLDIPNAK